MPSDLFEQRLHALARLAPELRHRQMSALHQLISDRYCAAVGAMTAGEAAQPSSDGRTRALVVGHIMAWERFFLQAAGELLAGVRQPRMFQLAGYLEPDGCERSFASIDEFNAYQLEKQAACPWPRIQSAALITSAALLAVFTHPGLLNPAALEAASPTRWQLPGGEELPSTTGWRLWTIVLEHEGVEHAPDLGMISLAGDLARLEKESE